MMELMEALDEYIPMPERDMDKPFLMPIEDVFSIIGSRDGGDGTRGAREGECGRGDGDRGHPRDAQASGDGCGDVPQAFGRR